MPATAEIRPAGVRADPLKAKRRDGRAGAVAAATSALGGHRRSGERCGDEQ
jgi:hypothetical protein